MQPNIETIWNAGEPVGDNNFGWGSIGTLPDASPPAPTLSPDHIPEPLEPWLSDAAERIQIPLEFVAIPAIVSLSSLIGRNVGIFPKRKDDWLVVPNLWGAIVGRPGHQKSPAIAEAIKPLQRLAAKAQEDYKLVAAANEASLQTASFHKKALDDRGKNAAKKGDTQKLKEIEADLTQLHLDQNESVETEKRYIVSDPTVEKLGELLNENPSGLLLHRDELSGWFRNLDKQGREGDREFYLEAWNGTGSYTYDRIGRGTKHIDALTLSIIGSIQPGKLSSYINGALNGGAGDDGLLQRIQMLVWPEPTMTWENIDRYPDKEAQSRANDIFSKLDCYTFPPQDEGIPALRFAGDAQDLFDKWRSKLEPRLRSDELTAAPAFESHISKYRSLMPSLALIFHLIDVVDNQEGLEVSLKAANLAVQWCDFLEAHAKKVYAAEITPDIAAAHALAKKIKSGEISNLCTVREVYRSHWAGLASPENVQSGLHLLTKLNWVRVSEIETSGRPSEVIEFHPDLRRNPK